MPAASASSSMAAASSARGGDADDLDDGLDYQPTLAGGVPEDDDDDAEDVDVGAPSDDEEGAPAWDADDGDPDRSDVAVRPSLALRSSSQGKKRKEADDEGKETTGDMSLDTGSNDDEDARKKKKMKQKERKQAKVSARAPTCDVLAQGNSLKLSTSGRTIGRRFRLFVFEITRRNVDRRT